MIQVSTPRLLANVTRSGAASQIVDAEFFLTVVWPDGSTEQWSSGRLESIDLAGAPNAALEPLARSAIADLFDELREAEARPDRRASQVAIEWRLGDGTDEGGVP